MGVKMGGWIFSPLVFLLHVYKFALLGTESAKHA